MDALFLSRTPGPPPFSFMNLIPALTKAARMFSMVSDLDSTSPVSTRANVLIGTPLCSESVSRVQSRSALAARIWAGVMVAYFVPLTLAVTLLVWHNLCHGAIASIHNKEVAMATSNAEQTKSVTIPAPKFGNAVFGIQGTEVLVIHRFSKKAKEEIRQKMAGGKAAASKRNREAKNFDDAYEQSRYKSKDGWDGLHAGSIRNAMISACRLVNFKMTLAKLSIFVQADGYDAIEPQVPLVRIYGKPVKQEDIARVEGGAPYVTVRAAYHDWKAKVRIRWDEDQFTIEDVTNLLSRVGQQVGLGEGRPDSKNSAGMGWGLFEVEKTNA